MLQRILIVVGLIACIGAFIFIFLPYHLDELTGRGPATRYYHSLPGVEEVPKIAALVQQAYKKYQADGKVSDNTTFEALIPYLSNAKPVNDAMMDSQADILNPAREHKPLQKYSRPTKCLLQEEYGCIRLANGALIRYFKTNFGSQIRSSKDAQFLPFEIDVDGKFSNRNDVFPYELERDGQVYSQMEIKLVTLF